ncbi:hypothetical protein E2C01_067843 [Portunus trituberculatus]|uniref:Uncharacterized protein n=1 Tax=Portunus trituberculatus TaxID=210409 RepID=A0A5B7HKW9_PORTR|nr:hypothetical protein [Portunus trituberculatus]
MMTAVQGDGSGVVETVCLVVEVGPLETKGVGKVKEGAEFLAVVAVGEDNGDDGMRCEGAALTRDKMVVEVPGKGYIVCTSQRGESRSLH